MNSQSKFLFPVENVLHLKQGWKRSTEKSSNILLQLNAFKYSITALFILSFLTLPFAFHLHIYLEEKEAQEGQIR